MTTKLRKGQYYKVTGGDFGVYWDGNSWIRFGCIGCEYARNNLNPLDRLNGNYQDRPAAWEAMTKTKLLPEHSHDVKLHKTWLAAGKPTIVISNKLMKKIDEETK